MVSAAPVSVSSTRKEDSTLNIIQNNESQRLVIAEIDPALAMSLGTSPEALIGSDLNDLLPDSINELVTSYLEYGDDAHDLSVVLGRTRGFALKHSKGRELRYSLKIMRDAATDSNPRFKLHVSRLQAMESLRQQLGITEVAEQDVLDTTAQMPNRASFLRHADLVIRGVREKKIQASLGLVKIDNYNTLIRNHGQAAAAALFSHLGQVCRMNMREDDLIGYVEPNRVALLFMETHGDNAKIPLNRIRWTFASTPITLKKETLELTLTATCVDIRSNTTPPQLIDECNKAFGVAEARNLGGNLIVDQELLSKSQ